MNHNTISFLISLNNIHYLSIYVGMCVLAPHEAKMILSIIVVIIH